MAYSHDGSFFCLVKDLPIVIPLQIAISVSANYFSFLMKNMNTRTLAKSR